MDPELESIKTISPSVLAPVAVQEALEIPEVPEGTDPGALSGKPIATVRTKVAPGSMFYIKFKTSGSESDGTAVAIRLSPNSWKLLWEETAASAEAALNVLGPIKARAETEEFVLVAADKTSTPLLQTVASCLPAGTSVPRQTEVWRPRLAEALKRAGHRWFALQRIRVESAPDARTSIPPTDRNE
jgi:hypothetical protein